MAGRTRMDRWTVGDADLGVGRSSTRGFCDRCDAEGDLYEVTNDLDGDWLYCLACARHTAALLAL